ncbi:MAG: UDP-3-O-[3-hydroxymyristoyl] N-acetylglucosamine deacetylase [Planctomycetes bacterium]|nr:UDP-3-O-[3-hydroxymyristoyl] N-acetylglucosamine deacetylase [Planctomycetota bacterium]
MHDTQKTIGRETRYSGIGMFRGENSSLCFKPATLNSGIFFTRVDLPGHPKVAAHVKRLSGDYKHICLKDAEAEIESVEHLMAALAVLGIDNLEVEIRGREVPAGDGSALLFLNLLEEAGVVKQKGERKIFIVKTPITVNSGQASITALPSEKGLVLSYTLDFNGSFAKKQSCEILFTEDSFRREIVSARTFGLSTYVDEFKKLGLGKGVTDDNSILINENGEMIKPISGKPAELRFPDELVRHKVLDLMGDLYLSNVAIQGRIVAHRSGHSLNVQMAEKIAMIAMNQ